MKIGNPANYHVQTWPAWWDEPDQVAELLRDIVDDSRAGTSERIPTPSGEHESVLLYVTGDEFTSYRDTLEVLTKSAATSNPTVRHEDIADLAVIRFLDERALEHVSSTAVARLPGGGAR